MIRGSRDLILWNRCKPRWWKNGWKRLDYIPRKRDGEMNDTRRLRYVEVMSNRRWFRYTETGGHDDWNDWRWRLG